MDSRQVSLCMQMKSAQNNHTDDLSKFQVQPKQNEKKYEIVEEPLNEDKSQSVHQEPEHQEEHEPEQKVIKRVQKTNVFAKQNSNDLSKKKVTQQSSGDIFSDLQKKRQNPFVQQTSMAPVAKQRKLM